MNGHDHGGGDDEFFGGAGGGLQFMGVLNALRTGDPMLDMIIAMCFPALLRFVFAGIHRLLESLRPLFDFKFHDEHERRIIHKTSVTMYGGRDTDEDSQNTILIKAINLYLHHQVKLKLVEAHVDLTSTEDKNASVGRNRYNYYDYDEGNRMYDDDDEDSKTVVGALSKYRIVQKPPPNQWHNLGEHGDGKSAAVVRLQIEKSEDERNNGGGGGHGQSNNTTRTEITHSYHFRSPSGPAIDVFIQKAYQWYMDELRKQTDNARYFYELKATDSMSKSFGGGGGGGGGDEDGGNGGSSAGRVCYKRYRLSDEKTFSSLFFRQKESVVKLLNHFQAKTGKYQIQGYPHKLGLLLHGAPGSGKSSLIKALAQYTGRSIINVPLSRVSTNTELMSIFFDHRKYVDGESSGVPIKLGFKDVIFVMEDIDAASKVVKRRDGKKRTPTTTRSATTTTALSSHSSAATLDYDEDGEDGAPKPKSFLRLLLESNEEDCKELVKKLLEKSSRLRQEAAKPELLTSIARRVAALPGLGLVGDLSQDNVTLQRIGNDALRTARQLEEDQATVDRYVARQARIILNMFEQQQQPEQQQPDDENKEDDGNDDNNINSSELDDAFVDELLLTSPHDYSYANSYEATSESATAVTAPLSANESEDDEIIPNQMTAATFSQLMDNNKSSNNMSAESNKPKTTMIGPSMWGKSSSPFLKDELNLSGLLNVLDGVVDSPGRIVIMTTNHVDHLDPALIRPGRIDKQLLLGYMEAVDVLSMLEHYFQLKLTEKQRVRVETALTGSSSSCPQEQDEATKIITKNNIHRLQQQQRGRQALQLTPAQIEQMMAEHDEIEDMITALEEYEGDRY